MEPTLRRKKLRQKRVVKVGSKCQEEGDTPITIKILLISQGHEVSLPTGRSPLGAVTVPSSTPVVGTTHQGRL